MIEYVHQHITSELNQNTKTDTIFILTSILLNLIALAINSGMAQQSREDTSLLMVMFIFVALVVVLNIVVIFGLLKGKQTRGKLISGLMKMYKDQQVDQYYDQSLIGNYNVRYTLFILVVITTGVIAVLVPFIIR